MKPTDAERTQLALSKEASLLGLPIDEVQQDMLRRGLKSAKAERVRMADARAVAADVLILTATPTEHEKFLEVVKRTGLTTRKVKGLRIIDGIEGLRVAERKLPEMGPFGPGGSAAETIRCVALTQATSVVLVGTCFGVASNVQQIGDVVVADRVCLYDSSTVTEGDGYVLAPYGAWQAQGDTITQGWPPPGVNRSLRQDAMVDAAPQWLDRFERVIGELVKEESAWTAWKGVVLSGGQIIESAEYRRWLVDSTGLDLESVVGGEMEVAGVLAAGVDWAMVKGIVDFGDPGTRDQVPVNRGLAATNAADFVVRTILRWNDT